MTKGAHEHWLAVGDDRPEVEEADPSACTWKWVGTAGAYWASCGYSLDISKPERVDEWSYCPKCGKPMELEVDE